MNGEQASIYAHQCLGKHLEVVLTKNLALYKTLQGDMAGSLLVFSKVGRDRWEIVKRRIETRKF